MPRLLTVREICERALRKIGEYSIIDQGADAAAMEEARYWLDMVIGHITADQRTWWLVPDTFSFTLTKDAASFDLLDQMATAAPEAGVQFPIEMFVASPSSARFEPVEIVRRQAYEEIQDKARGGRPEIVYIDRRNTPTAYLWPVPDQDGYSARLVAQAYVSDLTKAKTVNPEFTFEARRAWNLYIVTALAYEIGSGPVRTLPDAEVARLEKRSKGLLEELWAYDNHEQANSPKLVAFHD